MAVNPYIQYREDDEKHPEMRAFCKAIYLVSGLGAIFQCFEITVLPGLFILFVASMMIKAQKITARGTIYQSHVEWAGSTIKIGIFLLFPLAVIFACYFVWKYTGLAEAIRTAAQGEDMGDTINVIRGYLSANEAKVRSITTWAMVPPLLWWLRRCIVGYCRAKESQPIDFPGSLI